MRRGLLCVLIVAGSVLGTHAQHEWMEKVKEMFSSSRKNLVSMVLDTSNGDKMDGEVKRIIKTGNLSSLNLTVLLRNIPEKVYSIMGSGPLMTVDSNNLDILRKADMFSSNPSLAADIENMIRANGSMNTVKISLISALRSGGSKSRIRLLLSRLGDPNKWMKSNITDLRAMLFYLPLDMLMKIENEDAIKEVDMELKRCLSGSSSRSASCPTDQEMSGSSSTPRGRIIHGLRAWLISKAYGSPGSWTEDQFADMDLTSLPPVLFQQVSDRVLITRKRDVIRVIDGNDQKREMVGRQMVEKLLRIEKVMEMTQMVAVESFITSLKGLHEYLYLSDLPSIAKESSVLVNSMKQNTNRALERGALGAQAASKLFKTCSRAEKMSPSQAREMGMCSLSLLPAAQLGRTVTGMDMSASDMMQLTRCIENSAGATAMGKLTMMGDRVRQLAGNDLSRIPTILMKNMPISTFNNMPRTNAKKVLEDRIPLKPAQTNRLITKMGSGEIKELPADVRVMLSIEQAELFAGSNIINLAKIVDGVPATSALGQLAAMRTLSRTGVVTTNKILLPFMGATEARKVNNMTIRKYLRDMDLMQPTREACFVLKDIFVNTSKEMYDLRTESDVFNSLLTTDIETLPPCIIAAFGVYRLRSLGPIQKEVLYYRLLALKEQLLSSNAVPWTTAATVIDQAYRAMEKPVGLTIADVEVGGSNLVLAPASHIRATSINAIPLLLANFNKLAMTPLMPCLDSGRRDAIRNIIINYMGSEPEDWTDISSICCLLFTLDSGQLRRIPPGGMQSCTCQRMGEDLYRSQETIREMQCNRLGGSYQGDMDAKRMVEELRRKASLKLADPTGMECSNRPKRATRDVSICTRASITGVDDISNSDLERITTADLKTCLKALGSIPMDNMKAQILLKRITQTLDPANLSALSVKNMTDMGYVAKGITAEQIPGLPRFRSGRVDDLVAMLGDPLMKFSDAQLAAIAKKLKDHWKPWIQNWKSTDMLMANRIICGIEEADINSFSNNELKIALPSLLNTIEDCDIRKTLAPLALKAKTAYGGISKLNKAMVREWDVLFAALPPEDLATVPDEAFTGITPKAIKKMPNDAIKMMTAAQIRNLDGPAAASISDSQAAMFDKEKQAALKMSRLESCCSATGVTASVLLTLVAVLLSGPPPQH